MSTRLRGGSFVGISAGARPSEIRYRDRLVTFSGNAITASRMGSDNDTFLGADVSDPMRPALFQLSYGGATGGTVVALVPHKDLFLLGFTADETWVQQGDPHSGPRRQISDEVGIIGADAWCVNHDTVYFLSSSGLYSVGVDGGGLKALSEDKIPEDLTSVSDTTCTLTYNHSDRGVYIHKTGLDWFYDTARDQFWPFTTATADSHVLIGPFRLGQANTYGRVLNLHGSTAPSSAEVDWRLVMGNTAEEATSRGKAGIEAALTEYSYSTYVSASGSWTTHGRSHVAYPRIRGIWCCLWLSSQGTWAYEAAAMETIISGRWR